MKIMPYFWKDMDGLIKFRGFANKLPVTNNSAERNVKLVQDFIDAYHTESMKQDLFIAVAAKRKGGWLSKSATKKNKI